MSWFFYTGFFYKTQRTSLITKKILESPFQLKARDDLVVGKGF